MNHVLETLLPAKALAAESFQLLAPITGMTNPLVEGEKFSSYLQVIFDISLGIAIALAIIIMIYGGFQYLSTDAAWGKEEGKQKLTRSLWGLLIGLGIFIILNTLNPDLLKLDLTLKELKPIAAKPATSGPPSEPRVPNELARILADESNARSRLGAYGITINKSACSSVGQTNCTNVGGLPQQTIDGLGALKADCECALEVTGGTEFWLHSTHGYGRRVVDLKPLSGLNNFLGKPTPQSGDRVSKMGATFTFENTGDNANASGAHWHVSNL